MSSGNNGESTEKKPRNTSGLRPWQPGQSGNPSGRPKGQRSTAITVLERLRDADAWIEAYEMAKKGNDVRAMIEILRYNTDRRDGKAGVAEKPEADQQRDLTLDPRIQRAIDELRQPRQSTVPAVMPQ